MTNQEIRDLIVELRGQLRRVDKLIKTLEQLSTPARSAVRKPTRTTPAGDAPKTEGPITVA